MKRSKFTDEQREVRMCKRKGLPWHAAFYRPVAVSISSSSASMDILRPAA
jgi:hypothetical protein